MSPTQRIRRAALLAALAPACAATPVAAAHPPPGVSPVAPPAIALAAVVSPVPPLTPRRVVEEDHGVARVIMGGARAEIENSVARVGDGFFAEPIERAVHLRDGWAFVSQSGTLATSATFLGRITRRGVVPLREIDVPAHGRFAFVDPSGALVSVTGDGPPQAFATSPGPSPLDAAFRDADVGVVRVQGPWLQLTVDGGRSWRDLADVPTPALPRDFGGTLVFESHRGRFALGRYGALDPWNPTGSVLAYVQSLRAPGGDDEASTMLALARVDPAIALAMAQATLPDAVILDNDGSAAEVSLASGEPRWTDGSFDGRHCFARVWGRSTVALCAPADVRRRDETGTWRDVTTLRSQRVPALSDDGEHIFQLEPLDPDARRGRAMVYSATTAAWRAVGELPWNVEALAMHGANVLLFRGSQRKPGFVLLDASTGATIEPRMGGAATVPAEPTAVAAFDEDGRVFGTLYEPDRAVAVFAGDAHGIELFAPPDGAIDAGMMDARNGVAFGSARAAVFRTSDGGRTWSPVATTADGDLSRLEREWHPSRVRCNRLGCALAGVGAVMRSDVLSPTPAWLAPVDAPERAPENALSPLRVFACAVHTPEPDPHALPPPPDRGGSIPFALYDDGDTNALVSYAGVDSAGALGVRALWRSLPRGRVYRARAEALPGFMLTRGSRVLFADAWHLVVQSADEQGVWESTQVARAEGSFALLPGSDASERDANARLAVRDAAGDGHGGLYALASAVDAEDGVLLGALLGVAPRERPLEPLALAWDPRGTRPALARVGGTWGAAVADARTRRWVFYPAGGGPLADLLALPTSAIGACTRDADPNATLLRVDYAPPLPGVRDEPTDDTVDTRPGDAWITTLEWTDDGVCVRETAGLPFGATAPFSLASGTLRATHDGTLAGWAVRRDNTQPATRARIECVPQ